MAADSVFNNLSKVIFGLSSVLIGFAAFVLQASPVWLFVLLFAWAVIVIIYGRTKIMARVSEE